MRTPKAFLGATILMLFVVFFVECGKLATPESPEDALDAVLPYPRGNVMQDIPTSSTAWDRRDISSQSQVRKTTIEFIGSDYWEVTISYPSRSTEYYVYEVLVTNHKSGLHPGTRCPPGSPLYYMARQSLVLQVEERLELMLRQGIFISEL